MDLNNKYHECPFCKELIKGDVEFAKHIITRHGNDMEGEGKRLKEVSRSVREIIIRMIAKAMWGLET